MQKTLGIVAVSLLLFFLVQINNESTSNSYEPNVELSAVSADKTEGVQGDTDRDRNIASQSRNDAHSLQSDLSKIQPDEYYAETIVAGAQRQDPVTDLLTFRSGSLSAAQEERYNELHIEAWNPITHKECTNRGDSESLLRECYFVRRLASHPYEEKSFGELASLPDHDYEAALFAGRKADSSEAREAAYVKAVALSGRPGHLLELSLWEPSLENETEIDALSRRYRLEQIAALMGDERSSAKQLEAKIIALGGTEALQQAKTETRSLVRKMNLIRRDVAGLPPLLEVGDDSNG